jgi:hypothetical protein
VPRKRDTRSVISTFGERKHMKSKLLGFGSFFCSIYLLVMTAAIIVMPMFVDMEGEIPVPLRPLVIIAMSLLFVAVLGTWFFIIFDIVHIARNPVLSGGKKAGWICAIWFLNIFVIPVYWLNHQKGNHRTTNCTLSAGAAEA